MELIGLQSNFEDVKLGPDPAYEEATPSQLSPKEPQPYEEFVAIEDVTSESVYSNGGKLCFSAC